MIANLQKVLALSGLELSVHVSNFIITSQKIKQSLKITALVMCQREICSDISYSSQSFSCSNCTKPQGLNCICYGGKVYSHEFFLL